MTVEERAQQMIEDFIVWTNTPSEGKEELKARFVNHLRDQIEDCAKIVDVMERKRRRQSYGAMAVQANEIAYEIRALAGPKEERKESER